MTRTFTLAVERVADEPRFSERFRRNPERALRRYRLDRDQIEAIKAGDPASLSRHGLDVVAFQNGKRHGIRPHLRKLVAGVAIVGASVGLLAAPASAAGGEGKRLQRIGVRRASLRQALQGRAITVRGRLIEISSVRKGLRRNGIRAGAFGRAELRKAVDLFCDGKQCLFVGEELDPFVFETSD